MFRSLRALPYLPSRPEEFHPEPLTDPTGYSRIIRLVPSHGGCRLPLNKGSSRRTSWPTSAAMTHLLRSSPITGPSSLLRGSPSLSDASVLSASRWEPHP